MSKKHWIYIKRGLSESPKHRAAMGECVWLYMHIIDRADWDTGVAYDWRDQQEAADMGMPVDTLRNQRQKLEKLDYIRAKQKQHSQDLYIMEWRNPRDYGNEVKNPRSQGDLAKPPSRPSQGRHQGRHQVQVQKATPTLSSSSRLIESDAKPMPRQVQDAITAANRDVDRIFAFEGTKTEAAAQGKAWRLRHLFEFSSDVVALADELVRCFGSPGKGEAMALLQTIANLQENHVKPEDIAKTWEEIQSWSHKPTTPSETFVGKVRQTALARLQQSDDKPTASQSPLAKRLTGWKPRTGGG